MARRLRRVGRGLRDALRGPPGRPRHPQLGLRPAPARPRGRRAGRRGDLPQHRAAVLPEGVARGPAARDHDGRLEQRWAGLQAHNRWLVDFCNDTPGRRAGVAQITLHDIEASVAEIRWAHEAGLMGGVLLPGTPPGIGLPQLYDEYYEPLLQVCAELGVPLNHHTGSAAPPDGDHRPRRRGVPARGLVVGAPRAHPPHRLGACSSATPSCSSSSPSRARRGCPKSSTDSTYFFGRMRDAGGSQEQVWGKADRRRCR